MQTLLLYLLIMGLVVAGVFAIVWFVFGRGEDLPPVEPDTTLTRLPSAGVTGDDVRALRFAQTPRGYKQAEVDWALARLAHEVDDLRSVIARLRDREPVPGTSVDAHSDDVVADHENGGAGTWQPGPPTAPG
ncbi:DivIVA domain-containing protein [Gordonia lacunae]|uniref:Cell division protein DivIVA n=1 Tax=Gordonia lacunae TaxID=417102 RepID=A0A243QG10_9ACTN|nr:DivIVA domain-containing protein [Gordonia lacunae]OUC79734.1 cell division protein DivIVA [Gordonia lacunae]